MYRARERKLRNAELWEENLKETDRLESLGAGDMGIIKGMSNKWHGICELDLWG